MRYTRGFNKTFLWVSLLSLGALSACDNGQKTALSAQQLAEDQKRFMQQVNVCFLNEYASVEAFYQPINQVANALRERCLDEFSALRAAKLNYVMVRDVIEPAPKMVQFEVEMAEVFVESARSRAMSIFKHSPRVDPKPLPRISPPTAKQDSADSQNVF